MVLSALLKSFRLANQVWGEGPVHPQQRWSIMTWLINNIYHHSYCHIVYCLSMVLAWSSPTGPPSPSRTGQSFPDPPAPTSSLQRSKMCQLEWTIQRRRTSPFQQSSAQNKNEACPESCGLPRSSSGSRRRTLASTNSRRCLALRPRPVWASTRPWAHQLSQSTKARCVLRSELPFFPGAIRLFICIPQPSACVLQILLRIGMNWTPNFPGLRIQPVSITIANLDTRSSKRFEDFMQRTSEESPSSWRKPSFYIKSWIWDVEPFNPAAGLHHMQTYQPCSWPAGLPTLSFLQILNVRNKNKQSFAKIHRHLKKELNQKRTNPQTIKFANQSNFLWLPPIAAKSIRMCLLDSIWTPHRASSIKWSSRGTCNITLPTYLILLIHIDTLHCWYAQAPTNQTQEAQIHESTAPNPAFAAIHILRATTPQTTINQ